MELVAGTNALIIDLRHNHGGSPEGVVFWCSYLLDERPTHLGTGVVPDVAVPEAQAYDTAYATALRHVLAMDDVPPPIADEARDALAALPATGQG